MVWDLWGGESTDGTIVRYFFINTRELQLNRVAFQVHLCPDGSPSVAWRIWKLLPVRVDGAFTPLQSLSGASIAYDGASQC